MSLGVLRALINFGEREAIINSDCVRKLTKACRISMVQSNRRLAKTKLLVNISYVDQQHHWRVCYQVQQMEVCDIPKFWKANVILFFLFYYDVDARDFAL